MTCRVVCGRQLRIAFQVKTGETKMPAVTFPVPAGHQLGVEDITSQRGNGIHWTPWIQLDDLDFMDDLALLSHTQRQMQEDTNTDTDISGFLGLKAHRGESKKQHSSQHNPHNTGWRYTRRSDKLALLINKEGVMLI